MSSANRFCTVVVFLSGRGSNFRALVKKIETESLPIRIARVISDKASAAGLELAREKAIPTTVIPRDPQAQTAEEFHQKLQLATRSENPDLVVLAGFMRILSPQFIAEFRGRILNVHPSLLPSFRGLKAQEQALQSGARIAGCTVHYVTEELDGGPIIAQAAVPILSGDTVDTLSSRILQEEHKLYPSVVAGIAKGHISLSSEGKVVFHGVRCDENQAIRSLD